MDEKFIKIMKLYKNDIYRLIYSNIHNKLDTDDLTQNTFIKLYNHQNILNQSNENIKKWLIKVAINECKTNILSAWKRKVSFFKDNEENQLVSMNESNLLLDTIMSMNKKYRIILYLYYYEDYKIKEIANILNITETNAQTRLSRAREQLRFILKEEEE